MKEDIRESINSLEILIDGEPSPYKSTERTIDRKVQSNRVKFEGIGNPKYISDIFKTDVSNIILHRKPIIRPVMGGFGNGKSKTLKQAVDVILKKQTDVIIIKIDMTDFAGVKGKTIF